MPEEAEILKHEMNILDQRVKLVEKETELLGKSMAMEFDRISKAFAQMGNLLDLLYLETSVLIDLLAKKELFTTEEFTKILEDTAKKVEEQIIAAGKEAAGKEEPEAKKL